MLELERALSIYSDKLIDGEEVNLYDFCNEVETADREEFLELAKFVELTSSKKATDKFKSIFSKLNEYKEEYYGYGKVANFHSEKGADLNSDIIDKLFDEDFPDEE